jgi:hypothetical protein
LRIPLGSSRTALVSDSFLSSLPPAGFVRPWRVSVATDFVLPPAFVPSPFGFARAENRPD